MSIREGCAPPECGVGGNCVNTRLPLTWFALLCAMAVVCIVPQPTRAASSGLLSAVLSTAAAGPGVDAPESEPTGRPQSSALSYPSYTGLSLHLGLSSNFINAIPVAREVAVVLTEGAGRNSALKRLAKHLPDGFVNDIARIEISGSSSATLAWGGALRVEVGEEAIAEGVASGDAVRWLAMLRQGAEEQPGAHDYEIGVRAQLSTIGRCTISGCVPIALPSGSGRGAIGFNLSVLRGRSLYDASFAGVAQKMPNGKGKLVGMLDKMEWDETRGLAWGHAIDIAGAIALSERISVGVCLRNALGRITWEDVLFVEGILNTDTVTVDENGYLVYAPTMTGIQHTEDWSQMLPRALEAELVANLGGAHISAQLYCDSRRLLPAAAIEFDLSRIQSMVDVAVADEHGRLPRLELGCRLTPALRAMWHVRLHDQDERWSVLLGTDGLGPSTAKALAASVRLAFGF